MTREEIIKGLWCCNHAGNCWICPFDTKGGTTCLENLRAAAYDALKAQEPRVMTLEELGKLQEDDVVYVEIKPILDIDITCISVELIRFIKKVQDPVACIELHTTDSVGFFQTRESTELYWRCWTSRPTDEQRKATPWN